MFFQARVLLVVAAVAMTMGVDQASAQAKDRSGKDVVEAKCQSCHATGANGAPKIGDKKAWATRASQGLSSLTQSTLKGIRQMPSHGGSPDLSDLEIGRAVTYMVNQSGGNWVEPRSKTAKPPETSRARIANPSQARAAQ